MKKIISLVLVLAMVLAFPACGQSAQKDPAGSAAGGRYPLTLTDQAGRQVTIKKEPQRLISSYYITTSLIMALELDDRLVGVEDNADLRPVYGLSNPGILELPNIGTVKELDLESCAALTPDLAILPMKVKDSVPALEALGITVLIVNPESQELLSEMIRLVAAATDTAERGEELIGFIEKQENHLTEVLSNEERPGVYLSGNSSLLMTAGDAMYQSDMIRLAGGENAAAAIEDSYWVEIDYEQLLAWDPAYILLASDADYSVEDVLQDENLADCTAIKNGNVYQLPNKAEAWDSPVPSGILGSVWLAGVLHPDLVSEADAAAVIDRYYENFYDFIYSEN